MSNHSGRPRKQTRWATAAELGRLQWLGGNLYEAAVNMPRLLVDAQPHRSPGLLAAGSPLRYYLPTAPVVFVASAASLAHDWRAGSDRRAVAAAAGTASSAALTAYLVRAVNLRLLRGSMPLDPDETERLIKTWHRGNHADGVSDGRGVGFTPCIQGYWPRRIWTPWVRSWSKV
jgi:hypothetical protein